MVVWYKDFWHFEILSLKEAKEKAKVSGGEPYVLIEEQLRTGICIGMEMVDLKWLYKGKTYHSTAIVSNEHGGFVYILAVLGVRWYDTMTAPYNFLNYNVPTG